MKNQNWYNQPDCLRIKLEPDEIQKSSFDHDVMIVKKIDGKDHGALIPTHTLSENRDSAPVQLVGRQENDVILYFPLSNEGRDVWRISQEEFDRIKVES